LEVRRIDLQTALLIVPPVEVQIFAAPLREKYAGESFIQGPAHITLFFPFVEAEKVTYAKERIIALCSTLNPFNLTLDHYGRFETAHFLALKDETPLLSLHQALFNEFPDYPPYEGKYGPDLTPHLTLASQENQMEADAVILPPVPSFTFTVDSLHLYLGPAEGRIPWIPVALIPLKGEQ
jgi:2'-5' RNA ligase